MLAAMLHGHGWDGLPNHLAHRRVCNTALLALNVLGGVIVYGDHFGGAKAVSTVLCAWGFCSYVYGLYVTKTKMEMEMEIEKGGSDEKINEMEMTQIVIDNH